MLAKGSKRKHVENEEGVEGEALADMPSRVSYTLQRQTIFNISLLKLYSQRSGPEPRLERRLLISNMLRRIQEELRQEGSPRPLFLPADDPVDEGFCQGLPPFGVTPPLPLGPSPTDSSCLTPASQLEDEHSEDASFCTSPLSRPLPKDTFSALDDIEDLCPAPTTNAPGELESKYGEKQGNPKPELAESQHDSPAPCPASSGFLTDLALDDILFADIDTSMYDFDQCGASSGAVPTKASPLVTADDIVKSLSTPVAPNQPFKMDLAELDHIMEVLVGS